MANIILDPNHLSVAGTADNDIFTANPSSQGEFKIDGGTGFYTIEAAIAADLD